MILYSWPVPYWLNSRMGPADELGSTVGAAGRAFTRAESAWGEENA